MRFIGMGDNVVDRYVNKRVMFPGGNAVNFAVFAKKCGMDSSYLGVFADDKEGRLIRSSLTELGVDLSGCHVCPECATERCDVVLNEGDRTFVGSGWDEGKEHRSLKLGEREIEYLRGFDVIHCGCYAEMEDEMQKLQGFSCIRTFDFSSEEEYRTEAYLEKICPYIDIALFSGERMDADEAARLQQKVRSLGTACVLITNGTKGQTFYDGKKVYQGVVKLIPPVDTMGAGDSFFTAFVVSLMRSGWNRDTSADPETVRNAFEYAADFSAKTCLVEGSFGFAAHYGKEDKK
jgi:sugar/nucleoside kinase (ribokinase family)